MCRSSAAAYLMLRDGLWMLGACPNRGRYVGTVTAMAFETVFAEHRLRGKADGNPRERCFIRYASVNRRQCPEAPGGRSPAGVDFFGLLRETTSEIRSGRFPRGDEFQERPVVVRFVSAQVPIPLRGGCPRADDKCPSVDVQGKVNGTSEIRVRRAVRCVRPVTHSSVCRSAFDA